MEKLGMKLHKKPISLLLVSSITGIIFAGVLDGIDSRGVLNVNCVDVYAKSTIPKTVKVELTLYYDNGKIYNPKTNEASIDSTDKIVLTACPPGKYEGYSFKVSKK